MEKDTLEATHTFAVKSKKATTPTPDLSAEIAMTVEKLPGERVRCRRVSANTYRCNWIAPERQSGDALRFIDTFTIRASRFLHVTKPEGKLVIEDWTAKNN
jgi:hypothetical protein